MDIDIEKAIAELELGRAVIFPTDTVWGLGVSVAHCPSPKVLYELKGRPEGKPIAWLVDSNDALERYGQDVPSYAWDLAKEHWPGALTLVVRASSAVPKAYQSSEGTIGLRYPDSPEALALIEAVGCPLATTSANRSGEPSMPAGSERASIVLDCTGEKPVILRH